ncbi:MAG: hypothetical protein KGQ36_04785, partial [Rickettsiales bacterium]|nr:hypothetical protein [Rickettsiales bacterium]
RRFIDSKNLESWIKKRKEIEDINEKESITNQDKTKRIKLMSEIYDMLPNYFHNEIEKAFAASKFIGNWDFANFNLNNIGCKFELDREGNIISFTSAFVDFGNSGVIGFGGKYKELSHQRANTEAKSKEAKPQDYDPALKLTKDEERLVKYKMKREAKRIIDSDFSDIATNANSDKNFQNRLITQAKNNLIKRLDDDLDENLASIIVLDDGRKTGIEFKENEETKKQREELIKEEMIRICSTDNPSYEEKKLQNQLKNKSINNLYLSLIEAKESKSEEKSFALRNEDLIRSIIFKTSHHIREEEAHIVIDTKTKTLATETPATETPATTGLLTISDLPRNLPFAFLLKDALKQKTQEGNNYLDSNLLNVVKESKERLHLRESFYRDSEIEMAFRLSLITDETISYVTNKWNLGKDYKQTFAIPNNLPNPEIYQDKNLADIFKKRKNILANSVPKKIIDNWVKKNRAKAITAEESVRLSIIEQSDGSCDIVRTNSVSARTEDDIEYPEMKVLIAKIKSEIEKKKKEIHDNIDSEDEEMKETKQNIEDKKILLERNEESHKILESAAIDQIIKEQFIETLVKNITSMALEIKRDSARLEARTAELTNSKILEFIDRSSKTWNLEIFDSDPSYDLFDLRRIATIASKKTVSLSEPEPSFKSPIKSSPVRSMSKSTSTFSFITVDSDNDSDNDKKPSSETPHYQPDQNTLNLLIYDEFIKILDKISNNIQTADIPASSADAKSHSRLDGVEQKLVI